VPLSEHEQRLFEQIERSLSEDPKFASRLRSTDPRFHARRRIIIASVAVVLGLTVLVFGVGTNPLLGVAGFVVMLGGAAFGIQAFRRGRHPDLRIVGGTTSRSTGQRRSGGVVDRLEDRWRQRPEAEN
jgi:Protein of unknown function (DUF3040)